MGGRVLFLGYKANFRINFKEKISSMNQFTIYIYICRIGSDSTVSLVNCSRVPWIEDIKCAREHCCRNWMKTVIWEGRETTNTK